ncbi:MAG: hypothetical protein PF569_00460 [Candidatus Woesearchaeota archaeon]|jgi:hypothetical protein|nr:hypothetical protein [Candidatus Woesearchaeota archaeon]
MINRDISKNNKSNIIYKRIGCLNYDSKIQEEIIIAGGNYTVKLIINSLGSNENNLNSLLNFSKLLNFFHNVLLLGLYRSKPTFEGGSKW